MAHEVGPDGSSPLVSGADRRARLAVLAGFAIQGLTLSSIFTRLATIRDDLSMSEVDVVWVLAFVAGASAVGSIVAGSVAARLGSARALRLALAGASLTILLPALAGSPATLVVLTCGYGFFLGAVDALLGMQGVLVQDRYGRSIMTGFHAMWSAAAVVGAGYASLTIGLELPLGVSLAGIALAGLLLNLLLLGRLVPDVAARAPETDERAIGPGVAWKVPWVPVLLLAVPTFAMWAADSATSAWGTIYLQDGLGASAATAPAAFGAYQLVLLAMRLVGDPLVERWGAVRVIRVGGILAVVAVGLIVWAPSLGVVVVAFGLLGGGLALVPPLSFVAAARLDVPGGTTAIARVNVSNYVGYVVAAVGIGVVASVWGERAMFVVPLVLVVLLPLLASRFGDPTGAEDRDGPQRWGESSPGRTR